MKGYVRNFSKPEGNTAQVYQIEQALGFVTEYMVDYNITSKKVWDDMEEPTMVDEILEGKGKLRLLIEEERKSIHDFVLDNATHVEVYRRSHSSTRSLKKN